MLGLIREDETIRLPEPIPGRSKYAYQYVAYIILCMSKEYPKRTKLKKHHILPRSLGGLDGQNIIEISEEDHYEAHRLLWKAYGGKLAAAFFLMNDLHRRNFTSKLTGGDIATLREEALPYI